MDKVLINLKDFVASGYHWHKLSDKMRVKYGTDWSHKYGFNFKMLTKQEQKQYINVYKSTMLARGIEHVNLKF